MFFLLKFYIVVQVKTRFWRVHTIYVLDKKKKKIMLNPLQPIVLLILKWGVRGSTSHGHVYMITFRFGHIYIFKLLIQYLYLCSRGVAPRTRHREVQGSNPVRIFLFIHIIRIVIKLNL